MLQTKHLNHIKQSAASTLYYTKETTYSRQKQLDYIIRQNIIFTKLGLELAIEVFHKYTTNKSPIIDEIIALRADLTEFERTL